jgi:hypothetical protein
MITRFLPLFLLMLSPAFAAAPTPESHFGYKICVDNELLDWDRVVSDFKALPNSSDRMKFLKIGPTPEDRPTNAVAISSAASIVNETLHAEDARLLKFRLDTKSRLVCGLREDITVWSGENPTWEAPFENVVARYPDHGVLASGRLFWEKYPAGKLAFLDGPMGYGHIVMFGMRQEYRSQSFQNFKLVFNTVACT